MRSALRLLLVQPLIVQPLLLPSLGRVTSQVSVRPLARAPLTCRSRLLVSLADDDNLNGYRELGLAEDATYDEVMDAFMSLSETYSDDAERLLTLELAKNKVIDERLKQRMSGSLNAKVSSPFDAPPVVRTPPWVYAKRVAKRCAKPFAMPTVQHAKACVPLLGCMTVAKLIAPRTVLLGTLLMLVNSGMLIYSRNTDPVPRDEYGQVGEIRPLKRKPVALTVFFIVSCYFGSVLTAARAALLLPIFSLQTYQTLCIGISLILATLFLKAHEVFERDD